MQRLYTMVFNPSLSCTVAATGHTCSHGAFSHCWQSITWLTTATSSDSGSPLKYRSTRIQFISRCRLHSSLPTTGMLFSDWHASKHAPQPVHAFMSIDM